MDTILLLLGAWWLCGVLGFREKKPRKKSKPGYKPDNSCFEFYEEFLKRNGK